MVALASPSLQELGVWGCSLTDQAALTISRAFNELTGLEIGNTSISEFGVTSICRSLSRLVLLDLYSKEVCEAELKIRNRGLEIVARSLPLLETLNVGTNAKDVESCDVGEEGAVFVARHLIRLRNLHIGKRRVDLAGNHLGMEGAVALSNSLIDLTSLDIGTSKLKHRLSRLADFSGLLHRNAPEKPGGAEHGYTHQ